MPAKPLKQPETAVVDFLSLLALSLPSLCGTTLFFWEGQVNPGARQQLVEPVFSSRWSHKSISERSPVCC
jgi:hypothetical protein